MNEDKQCEAERKTVATISDEEIARVFRSVYCERHQEHINGRTGCRCTIESGCSGLTTDTDRMQEQSSDSSIQGLRTSTDTREIRACPDY